MESGKFNLLRMDNVGIAVESLDEAIEFFAELGLKNFHDFSPRP